MTPQRKYEHCQLGVSVAAAGVVGYNSGQVNRHHAFGALTLVVLLVAIIWVIIDLDRPRRGLILVSQQRMINRSKNNPSVVSSSTTPPGPRPRPIT